MLVSIVVGPEAALCQGPGCFVDPNLRSAVERELGVAGPAATDMLNLTELNAYGRGITDLAGLEYAEHLRRLNLRY